MAVSTIFELKLFWKFVAESYKAVKFIDETVDVNVNILNELNLLKARKFLDKIGMTKKFMNISVLVQF
jgi:hypothetical protein